MLDASIVHFMQSLSTAITPWLVGSAVGFLMLWLILLFGQMNAFAKPSAWFSALTPLKKVVAVATICLFAMWGGVMLTAIHLGLTPVRLMFRLYHISFGIGTKLPVSLSGQMR